MPINPLVYLISMIFSLVNLVLMVWIILSWLIAFNIVNRHQPLVASLSDALYRLTEPMLRPIRRFLPRTSIDISPIVLVLALHFIQYTIEYYAR